VQFLPDASDFSPDVAAPDFRDLRVSRASDGVGLVLLSNTGQAIPITPFSSDGNRFVLYLVVTQRIADAGGRRHTERFVGVYASNGSGWRPLFAAAGDLGKDSEQLRARVLELQLTPGTAPPISEADFWDHLFPQPGLDGARDAKARIVRISKPIEGAR
jgi:hypothetical protein